MVSRPGLHWWIGSISRNSSRHAGNRNQSGSLHSCHTLARYASFDAVPFISMHKTTVGQKSRKPMTIAVYEGKTHRRPTSEENDCLGFESLPLRHLASRWAAMQRSSNRGGCRPFLGTRLPSRPSPLPRDGPPCGIESELGARREHSSVLHVIPAKDAPLYAAVLVQHYGLIKNASFAGNPVYS